MGRQSIPTQVIWIFHRYHMHSFEVPEVHLWLARLCQYKLADPLGEPRRKSAVQNFLA